MLSNFYQQPHCSTSFGAGPGTPPVPHALPQRFRYCRSYLAPSATAFTPGHRLSAPWPGIPCSGFQIAAYPRREVGGFCVPTPPAGSLTPVLHFVPPGPVYTTSSPDHSANAFATVVRPSLPSLHRCSGTGLPAPWPLAC